MCTILGRGVWKLTHRPIRNFTLGGAGVDYESTDDESAVDDSDDDVGDVRASDRPEVAQQLRQAAADRQEVERGRLEIARLQALLEQAGARANNGIHSGVVVGGCT